MMTMRRRLAENGRGAVLALALGIASGCGSGQQSPPEPIEETSPPNVVFFVGDGFGVGAWSLAREWARTQGIPTVLDEAKHLGFVETRSEDQLVTDSAAAATAWSTGALGLQFAVGSQTEPPLPPLMDVLDRAGRAGGIVTTARITHATPAPFYARSESRYQENEIAAQLVAHPPTVAIGGGRRHFLTTGRGGKREDARDLIAEAEEAGVAVLQEFTTPLPVDRPVLMLLDMSHLPHELDRGQGPDLADLVLAAIERLGADGRPWFLLAEEAHVDRACHDHDGAGVAHNGLRLDRAVQAVLDHVDLDQTLVVVTADHVTASPTWHETARPESLDVVSMSVERMEARIFEGRSWPGTPRSLEAHALPVLDQGARHTGLEAGDLDRLLTAPDHYERRTALGKATSRRFGISFLSYRDHMASTTVHGHTGDPVPVRAWGVRAEEVAGTRNHAELGLWLRDVMEIEPDAAPLIDTPGIDR